MKRLIVSMVSVCALAGTAAAGDPKFEYGKRDDLKDVDKTKWEATAEAGAVVTTGNARTQSLTGDVKATRKAKKTKLSAEASANFQRSSDAVYVDSNVDGVVSESEVTRVSKTSAENAQAKLRYDRFLSEWDALFAAGLAGTDRIAGKELTGGLQVGYARTVYKTERHTISVEGGYDFTYESYVAAGSDAVAIHSARGFLGYEGKKGDNSLTGSVEALDNLNENSEAARFKDFRLTATAALSTKLTKSVSFSFSFTAKFDNVPAPAALPSGVMADPNDPPRSDKVDTTTKASLIVTLL